MAEPMRRHLKLTAVFRKVPEGYIAFIEELPGANIQGRTLDEARNNLREAAALVLEVNAPSLCKTSTRPACSVSHFVLLLGEAAEPDPSS
jgi:predicted RNase H-like HicB family nuclease